MRVVVLFFLLVFSLSGIGQDRPFITTWKTDNPGESCASCILIPTSGSGYDYEVDWDMDGVYDEQGITGDVTHDFGTPGTFTIAIRGAFPSIIFQSPISDNQKILSIDQWGDIEWETFSAAFAGCINLDIEASDEPDLSAVDDMSYMFSSASSLTKGLDNWDVSSVSDMRGMFTDASSFNGDLSTWDVSSVTDMNAMFFRATFFNQDLSTWDVSGVTDMRSMFWGTSSFNGDLSEWDVSSVTDMISMFDGASSFNGNLSNWDVSSVTDIMMMFFGATSFNGDLSNWDVSSVTGMLGMFRMFSDASSFNGDLSNWDVSSVIDMRRMFSGASSFNQDLSTWDVSSLNNMSSMLDSCGMRPRTYDSTLSGWATNPSTPDGITLGCLNLEFCEKRGRDDLFAKGWTIIGDSPADDADCTTATQELDSEYKSYIYLQPGRTKIYIANLNVTGKYKIYNRFGKTVGEGSYHQGKAIKIQHLPDGIFYLVVVTEQNRYPFVITKIN